MSNKQKPRPGSSLPPPKGRQTITVGSSKRPSTALIIGGVVAAVIALAVVIVLVAGGGGDDKESPEFYARQVEVTGPALSAAPENLGPGQADPAVGETAPVVSGQDFADDPVTIDPTADGPTMVVVLAHWCPHCNAEIPVLNQWRDSGAVPEALNVVGISTAVREDQPNYPPDKWLEDKGWEWPVLSDDLDSTAAQAFGISGFPTLIFVGSDGVVDWRVSGELPVELLRQLVAQGMAGES